MEVLYSKEIPDALSLYYRYRLERFISKIKNRTIINDLMQDTEQCDGLVLLADYTVCAVYKRFTTPLDILRLDTEGNVHRTIDTHHLCLFPKDTMEESIDTYNNFILKSSKEHPHMGALTIIAYHKFDNEW